LHARTKPSATWAKRAEAKQLEDRTMAAMYLQRLKIAMLNGNAGQCHRIVDEFSVEAEQAAQEWASKKK
jgi:hypothetical protein